MRKRLIALLLILVAPAWAGRVLPEDAQRGELIGYEANQISIGRKTFRLAPGVKIFDQSNRMIRPARLPERAPVAYETDPRGDVAKLWLLTPEELESSNR